MGCKCSSRFKVKWLRRLCTSFIEDSWDLAWEEQVQAWPQRVQEPLYQKDSPRLAHKQAPERNLHGHNEPEETYSNQYWFLNRDSVVRATWRGKLSLWHNRSYFLWCVI